ncbi:UNVERIFIED_CONTAM: hypothetical protein NCL1_55758 [Trichonephila clavipes]
MLFSDTLTGQLPNPSKVKQASVLNISCSVVEIDWKSFMGNKFFLLLEDETARVKTKDSLRDFGKKKNRRYELPLQWKISNIKEKLHNFDFFEKRFISGFFK